MSRPIPSLMADYQDKFVRVHSGDAPEPSQPYSGWWLEVFRLACICLLVSAIAFLGWAFS
jgi:hypothetical protein